MSKTFSSLNIGGIIYKVKDKSSISTPVSQGLPGQVLVVSKNGTTEWKSIESIDSSIGLITTSLNKIDSSVRSIDSSVSNLDTSISKIDSSVNELNNKIQRIDSSIGEIISNLDNREQGEDVLEEYNLVLDSSIHLIKVFTPYNCEWNLEVLPATSDEILWSQHKDNIVHSFLVERFGDNYDDSLYIINIDNNSKTYIAKETDEMFLETIETSMEFIVTYYEDYNTEPWAFIEYRINKEETINDEKNNPFNISSYFGISSTYVTYSIDKSLEQKYYARDYILQLKCKNEIKKTIELYIENSYTDADYYNILLPSNTLPWSDDTSGNTTFIRIISPTEWRIQESVSSGFIDIFTSSGVGSQNITLLFYENDNITERQTTLELYSLPDEILRKTLTITQLGKPENVYTDADYDIRVSDTILPYYNGKTFIQIISPTEWRIQETSSSGFTNISPSSGVGSQNITLSYDSNDNITTRETTLELYSLPDEILRKTLNIVQSAKSA